jgi:hypothetical protein
MITHLRADRGDGARRPGVAEGTPDGASDGMRTILSNRYEREQSDFDLPPPCDARSVGRTSGDRQPGLPIT